MLDEILDTCKKIFIGIVLFILSFCVVTFILKNNMIITVHLNLWGKFAENFIFQIPIWLYSIYMMIIGAIFCGSVMWWLMIGVEDKLEDEVKKKNKALQDLDALKKNVAKTVS